jgi:hypothetical protein
MDFAGANYLAILVAAIAGFVFGAIYYGVLSKQWVAAGRIAPDQARPGVAILAVTFVCELIMAWVLAGIMVTTMAVNHRYQAYGWNLTAIDGGHWLGVAVVMGAIIGWWGV